VIFHHDLDKHISTVDEEGVALSAIKALHAKGAISLYQQQAAPAIRDRGVRRVDDCGRDAASHP
jgi:hypothetical protein